jgi:hypothetical protein
MMARNMSYCRFENTLGELEDCYEAMSGYGGEDVEGSEKRARREMIKLCVTIAKEFGDELDENDEG